MTGCMTTQGPPGGFANHPMECRGAWNEWIRPIPLSIQSTIAHPIANPGQAVASQSSCLGVEANALTTGHERFLKPTKECPAKHPLRHLLQCEPAWFPNPCVAKTMHRPPQKSPDDWQMATAAFRLDLGLTSALNRWHPRTIPSSRDWIAIAANRLHPHHDATRHPDGANSDSNPAMRVVAAGFPTPRENLKSFLPAPQASAQLNQQPFEPFLAQHGPACIPKPTTSSTILSRSWPGNSCETRTEMVLN